MKRIVRYLINFVADLIKALSNMSPASNQHRQIHAKTFEEMKQMIVKFQYSMEEGYEPMTGESSGRVTKDLIIPRHTYIDFDNGIKCRAVKDYTDVLYDFEREAAKVLSTIEDIDDFYVMLFRFEADSFFPPHLHDTEQRIFVIKGDVMNTVPMERIPAQQFYIVDANVVHSYYSLKESFAIKMLRKSSDQGYVKLISSREDFRLKTH